VIVPAHETRAEDAAEDALYRLADDAECGEAAERSVPGGGW
jgi:hypothetical protein